MFSILSASSKHAVACDDEKGSNDNVQALTTMTTRIPQTSLPKEVAFHSDIDISPPKPLMGVVDDPSIAASE